MRYLNLLLCVICCGLFSTTCFAAGEIESQAFSGVNSYVPFSGRLPIYKLKAEFNRTTSDAAKFGNSESININNITGANDCSISLGNVITDNKSSSSNFGKKETIVYVDGDIVNASDCGRGRY